MPSLFRFQDNTLTCSPERPLLMGIVNVTSDSFSDGGRFLDADKAIAQGLCLAAEGADILDIGGESTRPGFTPVPADEEIRRVVPVIRGLASQTSLPLSIDTTKPAVAEAALQAGASIVNDVSALEAAGMVEVVKASQAGCIIVHHTPLAADGGSAVHQVAAWLISRAAELEAAGIPAENLMLDPGIGFGKTPDQNAELLRHCHELHQALGSTSLPLLLAMSRKSVLGHLSGRDNPSERDGATIGCALATLGSYEVLRVHEIGQVKDALRIFTVLS